MKTIIAFFVQRSLVVNLISIFVIVIGIYASFVINREAFPNVNLDQISITISYPGSSPEEVELLVITPIEQELKSIDGIDKMTSVSFPARGTIVLELDSKSSNRERMISDVQLAIDQAKLPLDLPYDPYVLEIDGRVFPIIQLAISAPVTDLELKRLGDRIKDDLLDIRGVSKVQILNNRKSELRILVDPQKLKSNRISIGDLQRILKSWNINAPGGEINTPQGQKSLRIVGQFKDPTDAENLIIRSNEFGEGIRLGDIATISEELEKPTEYYDVNGKPALVMLVMKKADGDIIESVKQIRSYLALISKKYGSDVKVSTFQDFSEKAQLRLSVLTTNGIVGLFLVFICLILFLRPSVALTTTWGLPIVFLSGLFLLHSIGVTLNLVSMLGFIMVLGMIVDDAIIVGENITFHMEEGVSPPKAATLGAYELMGPVSTTVLTTVAAFLPMLFMSGIIGKFIVSIPIVVISLLLLSWLESFFILPSHVSEFTHAHRNVKERAWLIKFENIYAYVLDKSLKHRVLTVMLSFLILIASIIMSANLMKFELFPSEGVEEFYIHATAKRGTSLQDMQAILHEINTEVRRNLDQTKLESIVITAGKMALDSVNDPLTQRGSRFGQLHIIFTPTLLRPEHDAQTEMNRILDILITEFLNLDISLHAKKPGPPTGRALQVEIISEQFDLSKKVAKNLKKYLENIKGVKSIETDLRRGDDELRIILDRKKAIYAGVDLATVSTHVRAIASGLRVSTIRRGKEEIDVTIRLPDDISKNVDYLKTIEIPNNRNGLIPLNKISRIEQVPAVATVRHSEGRQVLRVMANVDPKVITSLSLNRMVKNNKDIWLGNTKENVSVNFGGEQEKNQESFESLGIAFLFALIGIYFILAIQFNHIGYPFAVMLAIPFGAVGVILSFYVHDLLWKPMPLSFFSTMGMVALTGVVVNSSMILLVFIQRALKQGVNAYDAIMQAGRRRLRAVVLTAITTVVGLLPTAYGWGGMDPFVSPMALALSWGLIFATLVTLITIPALMAILLRAKLPN
ncbi:Acriflavin resistance protein [hydrothermal vent metagenome]|uniref:Acriflavin resistance protein n=2 Tax=hydrothermal vent metagenome TaxID=652676 RepID=A0A3B0ZSM5_9ZZZZ